MPANGRWDLIRRLKVNIGGVVPPAIFTRFGTQRFAPLLARNDALRDVTSDRKGGKRGGA